MGFCVFWTLELWRRVFSLCFFGRGWVLLPGGWNSWGSAPANHLHQALNKNTGCPSTRCQIVICLTSSIVGSHRVARLCPLMLISRVWTLSSTILFTCASLAHVYPQCKIRCSSCSSRATTPSSLSLCPPCAISLISFPPLTSQPVFRLRTLHHASPTPLTFDVASLNSAN